MPDCPHQEVEIVCQTPPDFPELATSLNYTVEQEPFEEPFLYYGMDYISFTCPRGYVFEGTQSRTQYAYCYNFTFVQDYDPSKKCIRKNR